MLWVIKAPIHEPDGQYVETHRNDHPAGAAPSRRYSRPATRRPQRLHQPYLAPPVQPGHRYVTQDVLPDHPLPGGPGHPQYPARCVVFAVGARPGFLRSIALPARVQETGQHDPRRLPTEDDATRLNRQDQLRLIRLLANRPASPSFLHKTSHESACSWCTVAFVATE